MKIIAPKVGDILWGATLLPRAAEVVVGVERRRTPLGAQSAMGPRGEFVGLRTYARASVPKVAGSRSGGDALREGGADLRRRWVNLPCLVVQREDFLKIHLRCYPREILFSQSIGGDRYWLRLSRRQCAANRRQAFEYLRGALEN